MPLAPHPPRRAAAAPSRHDPDRLVGRMSLNEYAAFDRSAVDRHELIDGEVVRMAGGSPEHNRICFDTGRALAEAIEAAELGCEVFGSDQRVYIGDRQSFYPDVAAVCGAAQFDQNDMLRNPMVVVEVLSPSTAAFDRGEKFLQYRSLPSLQHYVLIEQDRPSVTHFEKLAGGLWAIVGDLVSLEQTLSLKFGDVSVAVPLTAIYRRVPLAAPGEAAADAPEE